MTDILTHVRTALQHLDTATGMMRSGITRHLALDAAKAELKLAILKLEKALEENSAKQEAGREQPRRLDSAAG